MLISPHPDEIVEWFFSFMKVVKNDWRRKLDHGLNEENTEALLPIKVEGPEIEEFIKEYSSDEVVFWWDANERRKK